MVVHRESSGFTAIGKSGFCGIKGGTGIAFLWRKKRGVGELGELDGLLHTQRPFT